MFRSEAAAYLRGWDGEQLACPPPNLPLVIALTFEPELVAGAVRMASTWLQRSLPVGLSGVSGLLSYGNFTYLLKLGTTLHLFGERQDPLLEALAKSKPPKDKDCVAQHGLLKRFVNKQYPLIAPPRRAQRFSFDNLHKKVETVPVDTLYSFVINPHTPRWHERAQANLQLLTLLHFESDGITTHEAVLGRLRDDFLAHLPPDGTEALL